MRAALPPMGWNSWNQVQDRVDETTVLDAARALVDRGLAAAGYRYVVIDDGWQGRRRDSSGRITENHERFPSGMGELASQVHALGLQLGIYSAPGVTTCAGYLGSEGYEQEDAHQFAEWGVDFVKYDWCGAAPAARAREVERFTLMRRALDATGRDVVLSISEYGVEQPWEWAGGVAEMYRTTYDIWPTWSSVYSLLNQQLPISHLTRPGCWADPDMLQVGNGDLTDVENRSHFALWCLLSAPLFLGTDLRQADDDLVALLTDPELLALNQDPAGHGARVVAVDGQMMLLRKPLHDGRSAVAVLNHTDRQVSVTVAPGHVDSPQPGAFTLLDGSAVGDGWTVELAPHQVAVALTDPTHAA